MSDVGCIALVARTGVRDVEQFLFHTSMISTDGFTIPLSINAGQ
jgi:hypothetical protein